MTTQILETARLALRYLEPTDAPFIFELLNEPAWLRYIGDKGIRTVADAERYIADGPVRMYAQLGFGLYLVELKAHREPIGICGLLKRDSLDDVDLGFAFLARFWSHGYAYESAAAVMSYANRHLEIDRIVAITSPGNQASAKLLLKLGFTRDRALSPTGGGEDTILYRKPQQP